MTIEIIIKQEPLNQTKYKIFSGRYINNCLSNIKVLCNICTCGGRQLILYNTYQWFHLDTNFELSISDKAKKII